MDRLQLALTRSTTRGEARPLGKGEEEPTGSRIDRSRLDRKEDRPIVDRKEGRYQATPRPPSRRRTRRVGETKGSQDEAWIIDTIAYLA